MKFYRKYRDVLRLIVIFILIIVLIPFNYCSAKSNVWDDSWSYHQEIDIPVDTSLENAKYQPVDLSVTFENSCWAKDTNQHSIRIICQKSNEFIELESQIYDLKYLDDEHIKSCNIVFLIPEESDGDEQYFVYYDDSEKENPNYDDHVAIEEAYYRYEPISGYPLESGYYKILDDDYLNYAVSYEGQLMGYNTCQHVTKLKQGSVEALPKNGELFAAFDFKYTYEKSLFGYSSTSQSLLSKDIIVDGNLMLEFKIVSTSKNNDLKTTATYKYYHCPTTNTRIHTHVKHETLEEIKVFSDPPATNTDGVFASLQCGGVKSKSIEELNIGRILPFMHYSNDVGKISEYDVDIDPEYIPDDHDIRLISYQDNIDLGQNAWFSFDEGETGFSHAVIFSSNEILVSGTDEKDGLQLNAFEVDYPHLPGLENNVATIQVGRNSYEVGENHDIIIPDDFVVEFDAEFFSTKTDGYTVIEKEAEIYHELVKLKPWSDVEPSQDVEETEKHDLSVFVHLAPSPPLGSSLSAALGLNLSYISVELYRDEEFIYSRNAVRLPMRALEEIEDPSFLEKIFATIKMFDIKNSSFFKKAVFPELEQGEYVAKIYKENPRLSKEKKYIGFAIIDLQNDEKVHVICRSEASIFVTITDQNNDYVKNAEVLLKVDNATIAKQLTDDNGQATIKAPISSKKYDFNIVYNGEIVYQELVKLGFLRKFFSIKKTIDIQRYNLNLKVVDKWGQIPEVELNPVMNLKKGDDSTKIYGEKLENSNYIFYNLTPNVFELSLAFKSFEVNKEVKISKNQDLEIELPAEYDVKFNVYDLRGEPFENSKIIIRRNSKQLEIKNTESESIVTVPPAEYKVDVYFEDDLVGSRIIGVYGEKNYDLITNHQPVYPSIVLIIGCLLIITSLAFLFYKKDKRFFITILAISLVLISVFMPWWEINGSEDKTQTSTKLYFIPNNMITTTSTEETTAGEQSYLPDEFKIAVTMIILMSIAGCIFLAFNQFLISPDKRILHRLSEIFAVSSFIGSISIFVVAMNEVCKVGVGSIIGQGNLEVSAPGENMINSVYSTWGPSIGFYVYLVLIIILIIQILINISNRYRGGKMKDTKNTKTIQHPLFGITLKNWMQLVELNGGIDSKYFARGAFITIGSIVMMPVRAISRLKYDSKIENTEIKHPPVFIVGHWRSGTSYLHELLSEDPQFCYVSLWNTIMPDSYLLLENTKEFLSNFLPEERPMDSIKVHIDGPYEEEAGIAATSPWSFFHCLHFPKNAEEQYLKSIHFKGLTDKEKTEWKNNFLKFMKSVTYSNNGKRLLLKNPANTARISTILELFPDAYFIHIYRNPYKVYLSTKKMRLRVLDKLALQDANEEEIEKQVIENYKRMMNSFFEQQKLIPKERYVEISYEELVKDPLKQVKKIYSKLKLSGYENAVTGMKRYLDSKKNYKTNVYTIDKKILKHVDDNWDFTIKKWGYKPPKT